MSKSKKSKARDLEKAERRRVSRKAQREARPKPIAPEFGLILAGSRPGNDALVHPALATPKLKCAFLAPVDTGSGMVLAGGAEAMLPRILEVIQSPVNFVVAAKVEEPGVWELLLAHQGEPLRPFLRGECLPEVLDGLLYGPAESFDQLAELMAGVADEYKRQAPTLAEDLITAVISDAVASWPNWKEWADEARPGMHVQQQLEA